MALDETDNLQNPFLHKKRVFYRENVKRESRNFLKMKSNRDESDTSYIERLSDRVIVFAKMSLTQRVQLRMS